MTDEMSIKWELQKWPQDTYSATIVDGLSVEIRLHRFRSSQTVVIVCTENHAQRLKDHGFWNKGKTFHDSEPCEKAHPYAKDLVLELRKVFK